MLSNNYRLLKIIITTALMSALVWWGVSRAYEYELTFPEAVADLENHLGQEFAFSGKITKIDRDIITIKDRGMEVYLSYADDGAITSPLKIATIPVGKVISGRGYLTSEGAILVEDYHYHYFRWVKVWLSLLISGVMFLVFWMRFRWDWKSLEFREKGS